jgi:predicted ester cyclase
VASRWTIAGTHQGSFRGIAATGRSIVMPGVDFSRIVDGKIAEHWAQFDVTGVMVQIGAMSPPV